MRTLRQIRTERLLSVRELADAAGISFSTVHLIEQGKSTPQLRIIRQLSNALHVEPAQVKEFAEAIESRGKETRSRRTETAKAKRPTTGQTIEGR